MLQHLVIYSRYSFAAPLYKLNTALGVLLIMVSYTDMDALVLNISELSSLSPSLYTSEGSALSIICCMQQDSRGVAAMQKQQL